MSVDPIARHLKHRYSQRRLLAGVTLISLKGTVNVIFSDPSCKEGNALFASVKCLKGTSTESRIFLFKW